jgi:hypothetical protein
VWFGNKRASRSSTICYGAPVRDFPNGHLLCDLLDFGELENAGRKGCLFITAGDQASSYPVLLDISGNPGTVAMIITEGIYA